MSDPPDSPEISAITAAMGTKRVSSIGRILKRWPEFAPFVRLAGAAGRQVRMMSNLSDGGAVTPIDFAILKETAQSLPRSFPCHRMTLHFQAAGFSDEPELPATANPRGIAMLARAGVDVFAGHPTSAGISVTDSWWVNGRQRSLAALPRRSRSRGEKSFRLCRPMSRPFSRVAAKLARPCKCRS